MSKKTRKKSSKPSPKGRTTPARKPAAAKASAKTAAKSARKTAGRATGPASKKPAAKATKSTASKAAKPPRAAKTTSTKVPHQPTPKQLIKSNQSSVSGTGLAEGAKAPAFSLPRDGGGSVSLADYAGRKLVLFFYPRADTPGCTREAIDFSRLRDEFAETGVAVLGASADTVKAQESFRDKHALSVPLVSDQQHEMLEAFGAWGEKSMYGRTFMGIIRTTVLIGADGRIARIWRNVRVDGHADEVLAAARAL